MRQAELPEDDVRLVEQYCEQMWTTEHHDQVRGEVHVRGLNVTLCELRAPWDGRGSWIHEPFAQMRFRPATSDWALYWSDRNSRWHEYHEGYVFTGSMTRLLREVDEDPTSIFKG